MPTIADQLSDYAVSLRYQDLPDDVAHLAKRMIIDTLGCALGGYHSEPARIAREVASTVTSNPAGRVLGSGQLTSPDLATFANGVMVRYLDYNDGYTSKESGHPSDSIAATLTCGDVGRAGGKGLITSTVLAYEAFCRICDAVDIKPSGFDHVTVGCIASILGAAKSMGLDRDQTLQALEPWHRAQPGPVPDPDRRRFHVEGLRLRQRQPQRGLCGDTGPHGPDRAVPNI